MGCVVMELLPGWGTLIRFGGGKKKKEVEKLFLKGWSGTVAEERGRVSAACVHNYSCKDAIFFL